MSRDINSVCIWRRLVNVSVYWTLNAVIRNTLRDAGRFAGDFSYFCNSFLLLLRLYDDVFYLCIISYFKVSSVVCFASSCVCHYYVYLNMAVDHNSCDRRTYLRSYFKVSVLCSIFVLCRRVTQECRSFSSKDAPSFSIFPEPLLSLFHISV